MKILVLNYLNLSRENSDSLTPFTEEAIQMVNKITGELPRLALRKLYFLLERAADSESINEIDVKFVEANLQ